MFRDGVDRARLFAGVLGIVRHEVGEELRDLGVARLALDVVARRDVEADGDEPLLVPGTVGDVREARIAREVGHRGRGLRCRRDRGDRRGGGGRGGPPRSRLRDDVAESRGHEQSRRLKDGPHERGPGPEGADAAAHHLVLDQPECPAPELRRHLGLRILAERRPDGLEASHLAAAVFAGGEVGGELAPRGLRGLAGEPFDPVERYVAAVHELSPSEKWAFRVSTARKMRVLTAPTEIPSVSAISA